jgi:hypothetical protein
LLPASPAITTYNLGLRRKDLSENIFIIRANYFSSTPPGNSHGSLARALEIAKPAGRPSGTTQ